jgi:hypothetical protein
MGISEIPSHHQVATGAGVGTHTCLSPWTQLDKRTRIWYSVVMSHIRKIAMTALVVAIAIGVGAGAAALSNQDETEANPTDSSKPSAWEEAGAREETETTECGKVIAGWIDALTAGTEIEAVINEVGLQTPIFTAINRTWTQYQYNRARVGRPAAERQAVEQIWQECENVRYSDPNYAAH